jgi:N-acylglucosamine 2-epimerase
MNEIFNRGKKIEGMLMNEKLMNFYKDGLLADTIPWWQNRFIDREDGGFLTCFDADGSLLGTDKPVWLLARIIWMWSRLYNTVEKRGDWLEAAGHGMDFMLEHAFDADGRMFYSLTKQGSPLRKRRYLYTECFGVMALAEYARAEGSEKLLEKSKAAFSRNQKGSFLA